MKKLIKKIIPQVLIDSYRKVRIQKTFTNIFLNNGWSGEESVSGPGSSMERTAIIREKLPGIFKEYKIKTLLDIPCGDFNWFKSLDLEIIQYTGADIVAPLIRLNSQEYQKENIRFRVLNIIKDPLPAVDMIFCRDCLVHLSNQHIAKALNNIIRSGSKWLLTTSFIGRTNNEDIVTGSWRPLNLLAPPFNLPPALEIIMEDCKAEGGIYTDKSLSLWEIKRLEKLVI
jgi:SAM-dependent methyltransferase